MIYKVVNFIVKQQQGFFDKGVDYLWLMVLCDVVEDIGMYELIVSCVVLNKYINMLCGLYLMKFFFYSGIDCDYGEDIFLLSVKGKIKVLVQGEDFKKLFLDFELMRCLNVEDIKIV